MSMTCQTAAMLQSRVEAIRHDLCIPETEESWDKILRALLELSAICTSGGGNFPTELIAHIRSLARSLNNCMASERSRLSGATIDFVSTVASSLGSDFEPLTPTFFPSLLTLCGRPNKVFVIRARSCITNIVETTQSATLLTYFLHNIKDKSATIRLACAEGTLTCLNCCNPPDLEKEARVKEIEALMRSTARDASADVRQVGKKIFQAYKILLPDRVDGFVEPLSPTTKKYLEIPVQRSQTTTASQLSSSTSALRSTTSTLTASTSHRAQAHTRSASVTDRPIKNLSSSQTELPAVKPPVIVSTRPHLTSMPSRPVHAAPKVKGIMGPPPPPSSSLRPHFPTSRSASAMDHSRRVVSATAANPTAELGPFAHRGMPVRFTPGDPHPRVAAAQRSAGFQPQTRTLARATSVSDLHSAAAAVSTSSTASRHTEGGPVIRAKPSVAVRHPTGSRPTRTVVPAQDRAGTVSKSEERSRPGPKVTAHPTVRRRERVMSTVGGVTQPTLSQLARTRPPVDRKVTAPGSSKPVWGHGPARQRTVSMKVPRLGATAVSGKQRKAHEEASQGEEMEAAANTPLPDSPTPEVAKPSTPVPDDTEKSATSTEGKLVDMGDMISSENDKNNDQPVQENDVKDENLAHNLSAVQEESLVEDGVDSQIGATATVDLPQPVEDETTQPEESMQPLTVAGASSVLPVPQVVVGDESAARESTRAGSAVDALTGEGSPGIVISETPASPLVQSCQPSTPKSQKGALLDAVAPGMPPRTPISALLLSIQEGFIYTPPTPLSPPASYLNRPLSEICGSSIPFGITVDDFAEDD